ncbi:MAG: hypothetical protein LBN98_03585 [Prevotellaceae bacterium]|jgi:hypothetical protein|nr:hypothetical protein [Prevotellaceae bacterium]
MQSLFDVTNKPLKQAINKGFGKVEWGKPNYEFLQQLQNNGAAFAARKTQHQVRELTKALYDEKGNLKTWSKFKADTQNTVKDYNQTWLHTEYNTAVRRARIASIWRDTEEAELYVNMRWLPSRSANRREAHVLFYNRVFKRDNPIWNNGPGTLWNCKCGLEPTDDPAEDGGTPAAVKPAPGIDNNPGESGEIFTQSHPYYKSLTKAEEKAAAQLEKNNTFTTVEGDGGFLVHISKGQNKHEIKSNLAFAKRLVGIDKADITLLGVINEPGAINYDCIRHAFNEQWELKVPRGNNMQSAIQHELRGTKKHRFAFELTAEHNIRQIFKGIETTFISHKNRAKTIQKLDFLLPSGRLLRFVRKDFDSRISLLNAFKSQMAVKN